MFKKKPAVEKPISEKSIFEAAIDWESSRVEASEKSERRAWIIAGIAIGTTILSLSAVVIMMPLKEPPIPHIWRVDNKTGAHDLLTTIKDKAVTGDEVMDKYWLAKYVRARETYDWYSLQEDYDTVGLLSSPNVGASYAQLFDGKDALDKQYGKAMRTTVEIESVIPSTKNTGTVHFAKTTKRIDQMDSPGTITKWVATIAYEYRNTALIKESARLINPFGFQVLSYRVDPVMAGSNR